MTMYIQPGNTAEKSRLYCIFKIFHYSAWFRTGTALLTLAAVVSLLSVSAEAKGPPATFPGNYKGQEAIAKLAGRLPAVAAKHGWTAAHLKAVFLRDHDLSVDSSDRLLYQCGFGIPEGTVYPDPVAEGDSLVSVQTYPLEQTFMLHSRPGASKVIYLDFDGHRTTDTAWTRFNNGLPIDSQPMDTNGDPSTFSSTERELIQKIWLRIVEDYSMFDVDVTTEDPGIEALRKTAPNDEYYGIRAVISPTKIASYAGSGGVAYVGSFDDAVDLPAFAFSSALLNNEKYIAEAVAHEVGHTLGLSHDGKTDGTEYYSGHGNWAPIMGVGYYKAVTQWSKGEYVGANNREDDLATMLNYGVKYSEDYYGNTLNTATFLSGTTPSTSGIIHHRDDADVFSFSTGAGNISLSVTPAPRDADLDLALLLLDSSGKQVAAVNQTSNLAESLSLNVAAGMYYLVIDGVGTGDPTTGYSDYASLGQYVLTGSLQQTTTSNPPAFTNPTLVGDAATEGSEYIISIADTAFDPDGDPIYYSIVAGPSWLTATDDGTLSGTPGSGDVGLNRWTVEVTDDRDGSARATLEVNVNELQTPMDPTQTEQAPKAPAISSATTLGSTKIEVDWIDNSDNEVGFIIERSADNGASWVEAGTVGADTQSFSDGGLSPDWSYNYRVKAYNGAGDSTYSNQVQATTAQASPLTVTMVDSSVVKNKNRWDAMITVTALSGDLAVEGATVSGMWTGGVTGTASCVTGQYGQCTILSNNLKTNVTAPTFTIQSVAAEGFSYPDKVISITVTP